MTEPHPGASAAAPAVTLRPAQPSDAIGIARVLSLAARGLPQQRRAATSELAFVRDTVLAGQTVTVACMSTGIVGFIATHAGWIELLYVEPAWTGRGIGSRMLAQAATSDAKLYCYRSDRRACRFYEKHGFRAVASRAGHDVQAGLPDVLYIRETAATP